MDCAIDMTSLLDVAAIDPAIMFPAPYVVMHFTSSLITLPPTYFFPTSSNRAPSPLLLYP